MQGRVNSDSPTLLSCKCNVSIRGAMRCYVASGRRISMLVYKTGIEVELELELELELRQSKTCN